MVRTVPFWPPTAGFPACHTPIPPYLGPVSVWHGCYPCPLLRHVFSPSIPRSAGSVRFTPLPRPPPTTSRTLTVEPPARGPSSYLVPFRPLLATVLRDPPQTALSRGPQLRLDRLLCSLFLRLASSTDTNGDSRPPGTCIRFCCLLSLINRNSAASQSASRLLGQLL